MINYYLLTKPGIIMGNLFTVAAGFLLASKGNIDLWLFAATMLGLGLIIASACVFNNYIDRQTDKKMERTKNRPLATGSISEISAIFYATVLGLAGSFVLLAYANVLTFTVAAIGFFIYVVPYSLWKARTVYGTAIGSISGAVPPVVGYCAVSNDFDLGAAVLFIMMVLWQMPHFFAIALYHLDDYEDAGIPVLPLCKGIYRTKIHMLLYIMAFIPAAVLLTLFNYTGFIYLLATIGICLAWLGLGIRGFTTRDDQLWGKQMFQLSLLVIGAICFLIPLDLI